MAAGLVTTFSFLCLFSFIPSVTAEICYKYLYGLDTISCDYGCCGYNPTYCCPRPPAIIGPIIGSLVGGGVLLALLCIGICLCCRHRRQPGVIIQNSGTSQAVVIQQNTCSTQGGYVNTAAMPPGISYPGYGANPYCYSKNCHDYPQPPPEYQARAGPGYHGLPPPGYSLMPLTTENVPPPYNFPTAPNQPDTMSFQPEATSNQPAVTSHGNSFTCHQLEAIPHGNEFANVGIDNLSYTK